MCKEGSSLVCCTEHVVNNLVCIRIVYVFNDLCVSIYSCVCVVTSSHDKTGFYLRGVQIYLRQSNPARVRIWVISAVTAPNKHKSCKKCSSRTDSSVTATMIVK